MVQQSCPPLGLWMYTVWCILCKSGLFLQVTYRNLSTANDAKEHFVTEYVLKHGNWMTRARDFWILLLVLLSLLPFGVTTSFPVSWQLAILTSHPYPVLTKMKKEASLAQKFRTLRGPVGSWAQPQSHRISESNGVLPLASLVLCLPLYDAKVDRV
jgi:hypothetical protein